MVVRVDMVVQWVALTPHTFRVPGSIQRTVCMEFLCSCGFSLDSLISPTSQKHGSKIVSYDELALGVNIYVHGVMWWTGVPSRSYSRLMEYLFRVTEWEWCKPIQIIVYFLDHFLKVEHKIYSQWEHFTAKTITKRKPRENHKAFRNNTLKFTQGLCSHYRANLVVVSTVERLLYSCTQFS